MSGLKLFYFVLFGQAISLLGSTLTNFGLGVWAYQLSNEVTNFTTIAIASTLPGLLLGPFIGTLIDRVKRKTILFFAQFGSAVVTAVLAGLYWTDQLQVWHIIAIVPVASVCATMLQVGFTSCISLVVPRDQLSKANGMMGLGFGSVQLAGPLLAGLAIDTIGMRGIFLIDIATFIVGLLTIAIATIPTPKKDPTKEKFTFRHMYLDLRDAYRYMKEKKGILGGLYVFTLVWFNVSIVQVLFLPLVLGLGTRTDLGLVQSMGGVGTLVGGILMVVWKGASRQTYAILGTSLFISFMLIIIPIGQQIWMLALGAFIVMAAAPIAAASSQTLWQKKVEASYQGRVFSLRNTIMRSAQPLAFLSAGFLADNYFEPSMMEGKVLAQYFGDIWGIGQSRGVALMISCAGALSMVFVVLAWMVPGVRRVDIDLPDAEEPKIEVPADGEPKVEVS
ncbi:hypothetical protein A9Q81_24515 [Gammaproteobacteria bacterium 42_54_T18]|nr:hypothetical protein A9Q81_24515 [Gammaproteobacteria bacterium 42_54_T18]